MEIKQYLTELPILTSPEIGETLYLYIAVSDVSVSATFKENENRKHKPVFFVSKSLSATETRYNSLEQATLALYVDGKKLRPYFQAHSIVVLTDLPLQSTIHKPDLSGGMARWAIELSEFDIQHKSYLVIKGHILADFLAKIPQQDVNLGNTNWWVLSVDGASR